MKYPYTHAEGPLSLEFTGLGKPAFVSYAKILDQNGKEIAFGTVTEWSARDCIKLSDSQHRHFRKVSAAIGCRHYPRGVTNAL